MDKKIDRDLLARYAKGQCNAQELAQVKRFLLQPAWQQELEALLDEDFTEFTPTEPTKGESGAWNKRFREKHMQHFGGRLIPWRKHWMGYAAAAVLVILSAVVVVNNISAPQPDDQHLARQDDDALPGSDKALLQLADGTVVSLADVEHGRIATEHGLRIEKTQEGEIVYKADQQPRRAYAHALNSVVTPNGGQFRIVLPDGSKAWLNAASSITYPVHFSDGERRVKMTGEVYFEIAKATDGKNGLLPFFVETDKQEIQVLGTKFNVNAYGDEPYIRTALVEGSVKVTSAASGRSVLLQPGQEALLSDALTVKSADIDQQLGWKQGDFVFKDETLESVLRQISRWYDVQIECPPHLRKLRFAGIVSRSKPLSSFIKIMESTNDVKITLKERRLIVTE